MEEFNDYKKKLLVFRDSLPNELQKFAESEALTFLNLVKLRTPVDTGNLRNQWNCKGSVEPDGIDLHITNYAENEVGEQYASFVEYGHNQHVGQYVPKIGKRLVRDSVRGVYMMSRSINDIDLEIGKDFTKAIDDLARRCDLTYESNR